jgi:hypothetical protein
MCSRHIVGGDEGEVEGGRFDVARTRSGVCGLKRSRLVCSLCVVAVG